MSAQSSDGTPVGVHHELGSVAVLQIQVAPGAQPEEVCDEFVGRLRDQFGSGTLLGDASPLSEDDDLVAQSECFGLSS